MTLFDLVPPRLMSPIFAAAVLAALLVGPSCSAEETESNAPPATPVSEDATGTVTEADPPPAASEVETPAIAEGEPPTVEVMKELPESRDQIQLSYAPLVKEAAPAVVNVYAKRVVQARSPIMEDPFFRRFFGDGVFGMPEDRVQSSLGSGVIVRSDGIIVTNNHVIEGGEQFTIVLSDRREFEAELIVADERTDLAVLRIDPGNEELPALRFRDSDDLEVGDIVLAIGNPFGVGQTVTSGIVSALARTQVGVTDFQSFIQTDAAINPGNSGGALVTMDGGLVGINTAIFTRGGGSIGIGFAIPSKLVERVVNAAVTGGVVVRPWLGADTQRVTSEIADTIGLDRPVGVLVTRIHPKSPAANADIKLGDVITAIGGYEVFDTEGLGYRIATQEVDASIDLNVRRRGVLNTINVKLAPPPEDPPRNIQKIEGQNPVSGATVANLSPAFNEEIDVSPWQQGVIITKVERRSIASQLRLRARDIILEVDGAKIASVKDLKSALAGNGRSWDFVIRRGNRKISVTFRI